MRFAKRLQGALRRESAKWEDVDEFVRSEFEILADRIDVIVADIEEAYPGRKKKGGAS